MSPERDDYQDEEERDEFASRSIFAAGWFRAVLVLTVLAIVVVISLPYLLNWFEPTPPPRVARQAELAKPAPSTTAPPAVAPGPASSPTVTAPQEPKPAPPVTPPPPPKAASAPPASPSPAPKAIAEKPAAPAPVRKVEAEKPAGQAPARKAEVEKPAAPAPARKTEVEKTPARPTGEQAAAKAAAEKAPTKAQEKTADKPAAPSRVVAKADTPSRPATVASTKPSPESSRNYWIQLGAFKEQKNAEALAKALRDEGFPVQITPITHGTNEGKGTVQQHELFVSEAGVEKVNAALKGRGTGQRSAGGVAVKPAFSLQEAMTVSKRLTDEGFKVVIRPASGLAATSQGTLHAVRAGGYPNRTSAVAARDELSAKGHRGFLAEGPAK